MNDFDYIIVGSGTAGSVLAHRLSESSETRVLVLEAGPGWIPTNVDAAPLWYTLLGSDVDWRYQSVPQTGLNGRITNEPRGKMPGGSSNLYLMMHIRGHPSDFDNWAYHGAAGWAHQDLLPYFKKLERQEDPVDSWTGTDGLQVVTNAGRHHPNPLSRTFIDACIQLGYPEVADFNGRQMLGAGWHHIDVDNGRRCGTLAAYLEPALERPNLTLRTSAQAMRLVFDGQRCVGVTYRQKAATQPTGENRRVGHSSHDKTPEPGVHTARALEEVIICAGAIESPKLLLLSGIGDVEQLRHFDIPLVADVPGVGQNFHNHVLVGLIAETIDPVDPGHQNLSESVLFTASQPGMITPDLQLGFLHVPFDIIAGEQHPNAITILAGVIRPYSRGWIRLANADPFTKPAINPNYLSDRADVARLIQAVKLSRDIFSAPVFKELLRRELRPGLTVQTDSELENFVRNRADGYHHQVGSCRIGIDDEAVVDPRLRVYGVTGLRVVDASVIPTVPSGNCHTAIAVIAERAADLINEDRRK